MAMKEVEKAAVKKSSTGKENEPGTENAKKKIKEEKPPTKVVVRRLPPTMTEEQFKMQVSPLPEIDYFYFVAPDMTLVPNAFSRAYLNFVDQNDLFIFTDKFDGYVFVDSKGGEFPAIVEFAPFQRIPKNRPNRKKDAKMGTIESDPVYIAFKERLEAEKLEKKTTANTSKQHFFETSIDTEKKEMINTPLLEYIRNKRVERQRLRDEKREEKRKKDLERRKAKEDQRQKTKKEEDTTVVKTPDTPGPGPSPKAIPNVKESLVTKEKISRVLNYQNSSKERLKEKDTKSSSIKKKSEEMKSSHKEKFLESRPKPRAGKSYLEERQRQAERREEQKKKLSHSHSTSSVPDSKSPLLPEEKSSSQENKTVEEKPAPESKSKDRDIKQTDRTYKREESRRNSYKYDRYESKRDKDYDEPRRTKRVNEKSYSKGEDDRHEDGGRKRYSESRKYNESSQREKLKDKEKTKAYSQKKSASQGKSKTSADKPVKVKENELDESGPVEALKKRHINDNESKNKLIKKEEKSDVRKTSKLVPEDKVLISRRNSLDSKNCNSVGPLSSDENVGKKRRNSVGSTKEELSCSGKPFDIPAVETISKTASGDSTSVEISKSDEKLIPKRRNSTGETQRGGKVSTRRNSLGSGDSNKACSYKHHDSDNSGKKTNKNKQMRSVRDPRTERRIRNKDRPTMEIYRPGMGRFSKQRLGKEKVQGSSTEVDSPSPSPSPTPTLKPKGH